MHSGALISIAVCHVVVAEGTTSQFGFSGQEVQCRKCRNGLLLAKSISCCPIRTGFDYQHPQSGSQLSETPVQRGSGLYSTRHKHDP